MSRYIQHLISQGEHQQLDFKFQVNDSRKIARTLVSFANTDGGKLLIGVKDNGVVAGVHTDEEFHMVEAAATLYCKPEIDFACRQWAVDGKHILEFDIPALAHKPAFSLAEDNRWMAYVRVADQNILATPLQIKLWNRQQSPQGMLIKYGESEKMLLSYLAAHSSITLGKFSRLAKTPRYRAENILVNLICAGLIELVQEPDTLRFRLRETGPGEE
jgi:hypothetical protein